MTKPQNTKLILGGLAPSIADQLPEMTPFLAEHFQQDSEAITRLVVRGLITGKDADKARGRLVKQIQREMK